METKLVHATPKAIALAAIYICESLLLELEARQILQAAEVQGLLKDAVKTLRAAEGMTGAEDYFAASDLVDFIREQHDRVSN